MLKHLLFAWLCAAICGVCVCADTLKMNDAASRWTGGRCG
jgi:hypothetical protein